MTQEDFFNFCALLKGKFKATCPVPSRPIRELVFKKDSPLIMFYRDNWHGVMQSAVLIERTKDRQNEVDVGDPAKLYSEPIPISEAKYNDLKVLKRFCHPENFSFF